MKVTVRNYTATVCHTYSIVKFPRLFRVKNFFSLTTPDSTIKNKLAFCQLPANYSALEKKLTVPRMVVSPPCPNLLLFHNFLFLPVCGQSNDCLGHMCNLHVHNCLQVILLHQIWKSPRIPSGNTAHGSPTFQANRHRWPERASHPDADSRPHSSSLISSGDSHVLTLGFLALMCSNCFVTKPGSSVLQVTVKVFSLVAAVEIFLINLNSPASYQI